MSGGNHLPNLGLLDQGASMQNIDRLVEALEMEAKESRMSKHKKLFSDEPSNLALHVYLSPYREEPSSSAVQVYQPPERSIVLSFPNFGITLKELSMLSRDKVFPYVNTRRLKTDGILKISSELFQPTRSNIGTTSECIMDLSTTGLRKLVDFLVKEECHRIVPPYEVEAEFLKLTGRKYKKDAWQDITPWFGFSLIHSQPRSKGWIVDDFKKFSLVGHLDGYALDKQVRLVINQVQKMVGKANRNFCLTTLVLLVVAHVDPRMVDYRLDRHMWVSFEIRDRLGHDRKDKFLGGKFREGWAEWDSEKGELVREREALKEELNKAKEMAIEAKEMAIEAEQRMEAIRLEKEALQQ
ncbi:hypothetical protein R1flu_010804 [Riccia fluitans]|uniref:Uncharacterized protein n=1 Tax=Riccia fluitans TaxID=41844 RepID=A0ABD1ZA70_9MARC